MRAQQGSAAMPRLSFGFALVALLLLSAPTEAQKSDAAKAMKATAPMKMTPPGAGEAMRECDKMAMDQHIKMEDRARFVNDCVAKKMKK
jgi:hypothetical protein